MKKIRILAFTFFREIVRDKLFISLASGAILLIFASLILNEMIVGPKLKATKDLGISLLNLFSFFIVLFLGSHLVSNDLNGKKLHYLLSKPVSRIEYLTSIGISIFFALVLCNLVIGGTLVAISYLSGSLFLKGMLTAIFFILLKMLILLSFALLFPVFASPQLTMFLLTMVYIIGHTLQKALVILEKSSNRLLKNLIGFLNVILPNFELFNHKREILYNHPLTPPVFIHSLLYSISYSLLIFIIACHILKRRNV